MFEIIFLAVFALIFLLFAFIQDIKTTFVSDWLNFSLVLFALSFRFFYSLFSNSGFGFFYQGLIGFGIFFVLSMFFYYTRIFAGGDAKLMMALGAVLPFFNNLRSNLGFFLLFLLLFLFVGAIYGTITSLFFLSKNHKKFKNKFSKQLLKYKHFIFIINIFALFLMVFEFGNKFFFISGILVFILPYFYLYANTLDKYCLIKKVPAKNLLEGDWLAKDLKIKSKVVKANWEGLSLKDIKFIQKYKKYVFIKYGIPFAPVFFISFLILFILYLTNSFGFLNFLFGF